ncbi:16582_t:CDS:2, partial [Cetraspora pellucida]
VVMILQVVATFHKHAQSGTAMLPSKNHFFEYSRLRELFKALSQLEKSSNTKHSESLLSCKISLSFEISDELCVSILISVIIPSDTDDSDSEHDEQLPLSKKQKSYKKKYKKVIDSSDSDDSPEMNDLSDRQSSRKCKYRKKYKGVLALHDSE